VPLESYQMAAEYLGRNEAELAKIQKQRYQEVGTPAEVGARQAGRRVQETASYLASLPQGDRFLRETTGRLDPFGAAKTAAQGQLTDAEKAYAKALEKSGEIPEPRVTGTPSWAKSTIPEAMPGYKVPTA